MNPFLEFLRDQVWQFVGALIGLIAIVLTVTFFFKQRQRKELTYKVVSAVPVLSVGDEIKGRVQILFDGQTISDAEVAVIRVINSGQVPIVSSDYERPIAFEFGDNARVLSAEVVKTEPKDLQAELVASTNKVMIQPVLLNSGDWLLLKALVTPAKRNLSASARIVGVKAFKETIPFDFGQYMRIALGMVMLSMITGMMLMFAGVPESLVFIAFLAFAIPGFILFAYSGVRSSIDRTRELTMEDRQA